MNLDPVARYYGALEPHERFTLMVEAMARKDDAEADRLEESCPRLVYRQEDAEFRDRMKRSFSIACLACLNMREGLAQVRMAQAFRETCDHFAGPAEKVARVALLFGRAYGRWEAGKVDSVEVPDLEDLVVEPKADLYLAEQLRALAGVAEEAMTCVAESIQTAVGEAHAANPLSQWEGFGRFCKATLGVEPTTLIRAFGLGSQEPAVEVLRAYPKARADEAEAARWAEQWTGVWNRRFLPRR